MCLYFKYVANTTIECIPSHDSYVRRTIAFLFIHRIVLFISTIYVTGHEKIGLMCTQNLTTFLDFKLK